MESQDMSQKVVEVFPEAIMMLTYQAETMSAEYSVIMRDLP